MTAAVLAVRVLSSSQNFTVKEKQVARLAIIDEKTLKVINVSEANEINPIAGMICVFSDFADIGDSYYGDEFIKPPRPDLPPLTILEEIIALEMQMTNRRMREVLLSDAGKKWVSDIEDQIIVLRLKMQ